MENNVKSLTRSTTTRLFWKNMRNVNGFGSSFYQRQMATFQRLRVLSSLAFTALQAIEGLKTFCCPLKVSPEMPTLFKICGTFQSIVCPFAIICPSKSQKYHDTVPYKQDFIENLCDVKVAFHADFLRSVIVHTDSEHWEIQGDDPLWDIFKYIFKRKIPYRTISLFPK